MKRRKIEILNVSILDGVYWDEVGFSELVENDIFKITDFDENGKVSIDGEDGTSRFVATSNPYMGEDEFTIDMNEIEISDDELMGQYLEDNV